MARKVFVSSDMSVDERLIEVAEANPVATLIWPWMLTAFDDWGRAGANSRRLKAQLFPAIPMITIETIEEALGLYQSVGLLQLYEVNGKRYMAIPQDKWYKYQTHMNRKDRRPGKDKMNSDCPAPSEGIPTGPHGDAWGTTGPPRGPIPSPSPSPSPSRDTAITLEPAKKPRRSKKEEPQFAADSQEYRLAKLLRDRILDNLPTAKVPNDGEPRMQSWCKEMDLMLRVDKRDPAEIEELIDWCQRDSFWRSNILSPKKLREKYDQLALKRQERGERSGRSGKPAGSTRKTGKYDDLIIR